MKYPIADVAQALAVAITAGAAEVEIGEAASPTAIPMLTPARSGAEALDMERKGFQYSTGLLRWTPSQLDERKAVFMMHKADNVFRNIPADSLEFLVLAGIVEPISFTNPGSYGHEWDGKDLDTVFAELTSRTHGTPGTPA